MNYYYISVQPRLLYYAWQVEVMINNFMKYGIEPNNIHILHTYSVENETSLSINVKAWEKLINGYKDVNFYLYEDTRKKPIHYISSLRPNALKQHFRKYPELEQQSIFYSDCDIILLKHPLFKRHFFDNVCYMSDTSGYLNYDYITSKGHGIYEKMCEIVGIDPLIPKLMNSQTGGAQYLLKNVNSEFWEKVEHDSERLFYEITMINNKIKAENPEYHELQIWCADMWAVLWNLWITGHETIITPDLGFHWPGESTADDKKYSIYHNAGVVSSGDGYFYKGEYMNKLPYGEPNIYDKTKYTSVYFEEIIETGKKSVLI